MRRLLLALSGVVAALVLAAAPAGAHAELESTEPAGGAVLERAPARATLTFTEGVEVSFGAIRVYDVTGERLDTGRPRHPEGRRDAVALALPDLARGAYVVTWRVISADSHPVQGAFTFRVGGAGAEDTQALVQRLLAAEGGNTAVGAAYGLVRFAAFAALVLLVGATAFVLGLWPAGRSRASVRRLLAGAWAGAALTTAAGIALQGVYGAGLPLAHVVRPSVIEAVLDTRFGRAWLARLVLLGAAAPLLGAVLRAGRRVPTWQLVGLGAVGVGILVTPGIAGHPGADHPAAALVALDGLHLAAVSLWLGGLALLAVVVLRPGPAHDPATVVPRPGPAHDLPTVVPRFSRLAFGAVVVILATGSLQGWRQARSLDALTSTTYGRLLLTKVALFAGMVVLAALSRAWVRRRFTSGTLALGPGAMATGAPALGQLRRSVVGEALVAVAVLAVTALLVNAVPARTALAKPFSTELQTAELLIDVTVDPAKAGPVDVHTYTLSHAGAVTDVEELTAELTLPDKRIGPIDVPLRRAGPGHFAAYGFDVPIPGQWRLEVTARTSDIDQETAATTVPIR